MPGAIGALELSAKVALVVVPVNTVVGDRRRAPARSTTGSSGGRLLDLAFDVPIAVSPIIVGVALFFAYASASAGSGRGCCARGSW